MNCSRAQVDATVESLDRVAARLRTIRDIVRFGASAFNEAGLCFGHGTDNAVDEALALALHALHLDYSLEREFLDCVLTDAEVGRIYELFRRRIEERRPAAYLTGQTQFAGFRFAVDERVVIPRSPFAELVLRRFEPWLDPAGVGRILDLACGSGCIGIACAHLFPESEVDLADRDADALAVAAQNVAAHGLEARTRILRGDLFSALGASRYDLIVCNPPYVDAASYAALPPEYAHEPRVGLESGAEGLDYALAVLAAAAQHLAEDGLLFLEVGEARPALERRRPRLALTWVDLEHGGEGIAMISKAELCVPGALEAAA